MRRLLLGLAIATIAALSPCWVHADDQQIAQQIVQQLRQQKADGQLTGFGIDLEVESGIVWLKGHVRSSAQQALVLDTARRVGGVQQVINDLQIKAAAAPAPPKPRVQPALLTKESGGKLLKKPGELLTNLRGSVQGAFRPEKQEKKPVEQTKTAKRTAKPTAKPTVKSEPTLAILPTIEQPRLAQRPVETRPAAKRSEPRPATRPEPRPVVTRQPQVQAAPVSQVKPKAPSDEQLAETIIGRLRTQKDRGILKNFDVDIQVNDRVVWVSGRVASDTQRNLVLDVSRRVRGVKQVVNDLNVASAAPVQVASAPVKPAAPVSREPAAPVGTATAAAATTAAPTRAPAPFHYVPAPPARAASQAPLAFAPAQSVAYNQQYMGQPVAEVPAAAGVARARFDQPTMPGYAWPSYAAYPNYGAVTYPRQYSPTAWPYIGPFYPYPQVPLGWRKVTLEWDDGWWMLDFKSK